MFAFLSLLFGQLFGTSVSWFLALKALLVIFFMTVLPILLKNFFNYIVTGVLTLVSEQTVDAGPFVANITGVGGYIAGAIDLAGAVAVVVSAVAVKFSLRLIPFVRL